jgi:long-chain fatty acid transport protein
MTIFPAKTITGAILFLLLAVSICASVRAQGIALSGVGPVNRSMGGAATAAPIDAAGALHWNPASISGMQRSEVIFGLELLLPTEEVSSRIEPGALGGGFPPVALAGSDRGEPGVSPIPAIALVHKAENSPWTYGLGLFGIAGYRVNYPSSATNPILTPQPSAASGGIGGLGRVYAEAELLQIVPTISYALSDKLSIGFAPTLTMGRLAIDPLFLTAPDDANGDGFATYPPGRGTRYHWGAGFQVGVYYITDSCWHLGLSVKSPQWFETFRFHTENELGLPQVANVDFDFPMIVSLGTAYTGIENWLLALDVRYFDYKNTDGFRTSGFDGVGRVTGLGWSNLFSVHTGVQYRASDALYLRMGYLYQQNPVSDAEVLFNVPSPLILQHIVSVGASYELTRNLIVSLVYLHAFENEVRGPLQFPGTGPLPGTSVASAVSADAIGLGFTLRY